MRQVLPPAAGAATASRSPRCPRVGGSTALGFDRGKDSVVLTLTPGGKADVHLLPVRRAARRQQLSGAGGVRLLRVVGRAADRRRLLSARCSACAARPSTGDAARGPGRAGQVVPARLARVRTPQPLGVRRQAADRLPQHRRSGRPTAWSPRCRCPTLRPRGRSPTSPCDRVDATAHGASCLRTERGVHTSYEWLDLGPDSRTRASDSARGHPEPHPDVARRPTRGEHRVRRWALLRTDASSRRPRSIREVGGASSYGNLEGFALYVDGKRVLAEDRNIWGVTFAGTTTPSTPPRRPAARRTSSRVTSPRER